MKILIDECLPRKLKQELRDYEVVTVPEAGWAGQKNGALLRLISGVFDVFITIDGNLHNQQRLADQPVAFIVLTAINNKLETLVPLMAEVRRTLVTIQPGQVVRVPGESAQPRP
jgi:predicted nuclease of predicted toxin-antitoxin system